MSKFKYIGANAESFAGKNVAICFNDGTITIDEDYTCVCPPALEEVLDTHPDYERLSSAVAPVVKSEPEPEPVKEKPEPVKAKPAPKAKAKVKEDTVKQEAKKPESKTEATTPRRRRTRKASK